MENPHKTSPNKSFLDKEWQEKKYDERKALAISQKFSLSQIISKLLTLRDIDIDEIENFLDPKIKNILPNPFELQDMGIAVKRAILAIESKQKITLYGDYDVDGATSCAILARFFRFLDINTDIYIPDRIAEGYGPNSAALLKLKRNGSDLVIMVDCGTVAFEPLKTAQEAGLDIVVIDHHLGVIDKPQAIAIINPNLLNETFLHKNICAAAVTFLFIVAINKNLRESGFFKNFAEPNLMSLLDLVALGTVCDVMPLCGLNRAFVYAGLKVMQQRKNLGLRNLADIAGIDSAPSAYNLGFIIGPRINAGGRVGSADLGARILSSENEDEVVEIAAKLEEFNKNRQEIEARVLQEAQENLENKIDGFSSEDPVIFASSKNWHQGVIGIVASRLKDIYNKPTIVMAIDQNGKAKASCRSINGIDLGKQILRAKLEGLIIEGGGHEMAGGFAIEVNKINDLHAYFCKNLQEKISEILQRNRFEFDLSVDLAQINLDVIKELSKLEPYGNGNPKPKFLIRDLYKIRANLIGKNQDHLSCIFSSKGPVGFDKNIQAIAFRATNSGLAQAIIAHKNSQPLDLIGTISINSWMDSNKLQIQIEDVIFKNS